MSVKFYEDPEFLRSQTWMLMAAAAIFALMLKGPFFILTVTGDLPFATLDVMPDGNDLRAATNDFFVRLAANLATGLTLAAGAGCLLMLASYKKRRFQMRLATILTAAALVIPIAAYASVSLFIPKENLSVSYRMGWALFLPVAAVIFILTARRNIAKDEAKIRSMNRFW